MVNPPLLKGDSDQLVLKMLAVPELHLLIGLVDKLLTEFENKVFPSKAAERSFMDNYLKDVNIVRKSYQGAHSLEGNQSLQFLKKVDRLERELQNQGGEILLTGLPYIHVMRSLAKVVHSCFGVTLYDSYRSDILAFKESYLSLGITVTPKAHILFQHATEFLELVQTEEEKLGLGYFSEQSFESMHHDVKVLWDKVKVTAGHPDFPEKLRDFIAAYNARHM